MRTHAGLFCAKKRVLVPGCGYGHDAGLLANQVSELVGLDLAEAPLNEARRRYPSPNVRWEKGDFFTYGKTERREFSLVWEHTCFCAIPRERRVDYVRATADVLAPHGLLCGIFFLRPEVGPGSSGPPFGVTREELHRLFGQRFELRWDLRPLETYPGREGRETVMLWRKKREGSESLP